jgi:predicted nucleic acid-binding protein
MATGKPKFYWDTAPIIAWITDEKRVDPSEMDGLAEVIDLAERNKATIFTSVLWRSEVLTGDLSASQKKRLTEIFEFRLIEEVGIDSRIMDLASEIRAYHKKDGSKSVIRNIRVPDAIHLATAIYYEATEFHTFDGKKPDGGKGKLLTLDGNVAGHRLKVCAPHAEQLRLNFPSGDDDKPVVDADE